MSLCLLIKPEAKMATLYRHRAHSHKTTILSLQHQTQKTQHKTDRDKIERELGSNALTSHSCLKSWNTEKCTDVWAVKRDIHRNITQQRMDSNTVMEDLALLQSTNTHIWSITSLACHLNCKSKRKYCDNLLQKKCQLNTSEANRWTCVSNQKHSAQALSKIYMKTKT